MLVEVRLPHTDKVCGEARYFTFVTFSSETAYQKEFGQSCGFRVGNSRTHAEAVLKP